jgi:hypothetical protein
MQRRAFLAGLATTLLAGTAARTAWPTCGCYHEGRLYLGYGNSIMMDTIPPAARGLSLDKLIQARTAFGRQWDELAMLVQPS